MELLIFMKWVIHNNLKVQKSQVSNTHKIIVYHSTPKFNRLIRIKYHLVNRNQTPRLLPFLKSFSCWMYVKHLASGGSVWKGATHPKPNEDYYLYKRRNSGASFRFRRSL